MKLLGLASGLVASITAIAAPNAVLWPQWTQHDDDSTVIIDHSVWDTLLKKYVVTGQEGIHRFRYAQVNSNDRALLEQYIDALTRLTISRYNRIEQRAFWINLYNALTVRTVLEHYPVKTILDIKLSSGWFSRGPWKAKLVTIENTPVSLNDIEHRILRPIWKDPLTHYALNCASMGCPNLSRNAYTAANMSTLLKQSARDYINHVRGVEIDHNGDLIVSCIYHWFKSDFGDEDKTVIAHLAHYADPDLAIKLSHIERIEDCQYNWELNDSAL